MVGNVFIMTGLTMISDVVMSKHCVFFVSRRVGQLHSPRPKQTIIKTINLAFYLSVQNKSVQLIILYLSSKSQKLFLIQLCL